MEPAHHQVRIGVAVQDSLVRWSAELVDGEGQQVGLAHLGHTLADATEKLASALRADAMTKED